MKSNRSSNHASKVFERELAAVGVEVAKLDQGLERAEGDGWMFRGMTVRGPLQGETGDWLIVTRAYIDGVASVAFTGGETLLGTLRAAAARWNNRQLKWKVDEYER